jgi:hypothetical protein
MKDWARKPMAATATSFVLDATSFAPARIDETTITFEPTASSSGSIVNTVQLAATYALAFTSPVPLETSDAGCFIRLTFPDDFGFDASTFTSFEAGGDLTNRMATASGDEPSLYDAATDFAASKFVFQGCTRQGDEPSYQPSTVAVELGSITNPYSKRTTGAITIEIATDDAFTSVVAKTTALTVDASKLTVNAISALAVDVPASPASQRVVQENVEEMALEFTTTSVIPGTDSTPDAKVADGESFQQAAHVYFPRDFSL